MFNLTPESEARVRKRNTIVAVREVRFYRWYRQAVVQVLIKGIIMGPLVMWWFLWIMELMDVVDAHWDDILLSGSILSFIWLSLSACFHWQIALDVWSFFSIFWSVPIILAAVDLIHIEEYIFGITLVLIGLMSLADGFLSISFQLPRFQWYSAAELYVRKNVKRKVEKQSKPVGVGIPFMLIPLDGGEYIPMSEYPRMSTPSTSQQAYFD